MPSVEMIAFDSKKMKERVNKKVHGTQAEVFKRIAKNTERSTSTVQRWFREEMMPAVSFKKINDWIETVKPKQTGEPKQMNFCEVDFCDLTNDKEAVENKKFTASPLRLTPPVEKRFRSLCDFLDYDAGEMLDRIVTNYLNNAKGKFGGEDEV